MYIQYILCSITDTAKLSTGEVTDNSKYDRWLYTSTVYTHTVYIPHSLCVLGLQFYSLSETQSEDGTGTFCRWSDSLPATMCR